jgi:hypothetical protein
MDWKPDLATLKSWGTQDKWPQRYFEWLREEAKGPGDLPRVPPGGRDAVHTMYRPLCDVLVTIINAEDEALEDFFEGKLATLSAVKDYDTSSYYSRNAVATRVAHAVAYWDLICDMLQYSGPITPEVIAEYAEKISAAQPYGGPMA